MKSTRRVTKKRTSAKRRTTGKRIDGLIVKAVSGSKERSGVSLATLRRSLSASGYDVVKNKARIRIALRKLVRKGTLVQTKGTGALGVFKLNPAHTRLTKRAPKRRRRAGAKRRASKKPARKRAAKRSTRKGRKRRPKKSTRRPRKTRAAKPKRAKRRARKTKKTARRRT